VPGFVYRQESRAPKMPSADRYLAGLGRRRVKSLDDALLICDVELYTHNHSVPAFYRYKMGRPDSARPQCLGDWDTFAPPDALLRFRFRDEYPISLFGPEDHWGFFVSIPRIKLAVGDALALKIWDRDSGTAESGNMNPKRDEYMGEANVTFDGNLPIVLKSWYFLARCNAMSNPRAGAKSWLDASDRLLKQAANWRPRAELYNFGRNESLNRLTENYLPGNLRYPAGFLGWDAPEIVSRLQRVREIGEAEDEKRRALVVELRRRSPLVKPGTDLAGAKVVRFACESGECTLEVEGATSLCDLRASVQVAGVNDEGDFQTPQVMREVDGEWRDCAELQRANAKVQRGRARMRIRFRESPVLIWAGRSGSAKIYKLGE
jgi:hypothetical protein